MKKNKEGKSVAFLKRDFGEGRWFQRFEINKEDQIKTENPSFLMARPTEKIHSQGHRVSVK